jgi:hypothetical protein
MVETSQLTQYQQLRLVEEVTGTKITLGRYESVKGLQVDDDRVILVMLRVQYKPGVRADRILHTGVTVYEWKLKNGSWHSELPMTVWVKPEIEFIENLEGKTFEEQLDSYRWAIMCERPGTAKTPMDWMQSTRPLEY